MSRSYREPYWVDTYGSKVKKLSKRYANKKVRKATDVPDGKAYRKFSDPWNICDWKCWNSLKISYWFINGEVRISFPTPDWKARRK